MNPFLRIEESTLTNGTPLLKISNLRDVKELQHFIRWIEQHLVSGEGFEMQVGDNFLLSVAVLGHNKQGITARIRIRLTTKRVMFTGFVIDATIDGTRKMILDMSGAILENPMTRSQKRYPKRR